MSTTKEATQRAVAATMPMALHQLADHITNYRLPGPADINLPGTLIGDHELPTALVLLDERSTGAWIASLDTAADAATVTEHAGGAWHDLNGVANCVRVRLSWWTSALLVETCVGEAGTCGALVGGKDDVEPGCLHGRGLCAVHRSECSECVDDRRQDRADGSDR